MKQILFATAASAASLIATPALAQAAPVGPRVEAVVGYDKVKALGESDGGALFGEAIQRRLDAVGRAFGMPVAIV